MNHPIIASCCICILIVGLYIDHWMLWNLDDRVRKLEELNKEIPHDMD